MDKNKAIEEGLTLSEMQQIIEETIKSLQEGKFDKEVEKIKKNWGGELEPEEEFDAFEFFGDAGDAAEADIRAEFGDDEFTPFGTMEDPRMLRDLEEGEIKWSEYNGKMYPEILSNGTRVSVGGREGVIDGNFGNRNDLYATYKITFDDGERAEVSTADKSIKIIDDVNEMSQPGLFKPQDSEGKDINLKALVINLDNSKKGRVIGFGDDGQGNLIVRVDWQWPTDMKFMHPREMGEKREKPEELIVQSLKEEETMENKISEGDAPYEGSWKEYNQELSYAESQLYWAIVDFKREGGEKEEAIKKIEHIFSEDTIEESGRGLGKGVKNSGDRNVKMRDDHHSAPLTNLNESVNNSIKTLFDSSITKKQLQQFIAEEAKKVAKNLKG